MKTYEMGAAVCMACLMSTATIVEAQGASPDWSGFYVGAFAGYSSLDFDAKYVGPAVGTPLKFDQSAEDFIVGGYAGYNFQRGRYVYGPEVDIGWLPDADGAASPGGAAGLEVSVTGHIRGRLGYLVQDDLLLYGGLGLAISDVDVTRVPAAFTPVDKSSSVMYGVSLGVGADYAVSEDVSIRFEYIYDRYFDQGIADTELNGGVPFFPETKTDVDAHTVRFGVSIALN